MINIQTDPEFSYADILSLNMNEIVQSKGSDQASISEKKKISAYHC